MPMLRHSMETVDERVEIAGRLSVVTVTVRSEDWSDAMRLHSGALAAVKALGGHGGGPEGGKP